MWLYKSGFVLHVPICVMINIHTYCSLPLSTSPHHRLGRLRRTGGDRSPRDPGRSTGSGLRELHRHTWRFGGGSGQSGRRSENAKNGSALQSVDSVARGSTSNGLRAGGFMMLMVLQENETENNNAHNQFVLRPTLSRTISDLSHWDLKFDPREQLSNSV